MLIIMLNIAKSVLSDLTFSTFCTLSYEHRRKEFWFKTKTSNNKFKNKGI